MSWRLPLLSILYVFLPHANFAADVHLGDAVASKGRSSGSADIRTGPIVVASKTGAKLDTHLMTGGGTDDTLALQAVLNRAAGGTPVYLIIDGPALVSGLDVYGNTTLECIEGGGLYLKDGSSRPIIRNVHRSNQTITDTHISIRGCFLNGNRAHQPGYADAPLNADGKNNQRADGSFITGLQFLGVHYLSVRDSTLWNTRAFGSLIGNGSYIDIENVIVDHGEDRDSPYVGNTDGLDFIGPLQYLTIENVKLRTGDDGIALSAMGFSADEQGPITDVLIHNVHLNEMWQGIRLLSTTSRVDRVTISNVTGTVRGHYVADLSHWDDPRGLGNFGSIIFDNVNVDRVKANPQAVAKVIEFLKKKENVALSRVFNGGYTPLFTVDAHVETLILRNVVTQVVEDLPIIGSRRPILRLGPDAHVRTLAAQLTIQDPKLKTIPLELDQGSHVEHLDLALNWQGDSVDQSKQPLVNLGGAIGQLQWVDTPPMYVEGRVVAGNLAGIDVIFTQKLKARLSKAGARVAVNGKSTKILSAALQPDGYTVRYALPLHPRPDDILTWSYDATEGDLQNLDGAFLHSVSQKLIQFGR